MGCVDFQTDYDPTDPDALPERQRVRDQQAMLEAKERRDHLVWMLQGEKGRRELRRQLRETGFDVTVPYAPNFFDRHGGEMARRVGLCAPGLQLIWSLLLMVARGDAPFDQFQALFTETLDE